MKATMLCGFVLFIFLICASGCIEKAEMAKVDKSKIAETCVQACERAKASGQNLENGPCLLNPIPEYPDWVCDVAHSPRVDVDNLPENQCSAYRAGSASHFVEVDPNCELIKVV
jgi:hypothetical protein